MSKSMPRRSISVRGETYRAIKEFCDERGLSASYLTEVALARLLEAEGADSLPPPIPDSTKYRDALGKTVLLSRDPAAPEKEEPRPGTRDIRIADIMAAARKAKEKQRTAALPKPPAPVPVREIRSTAPGSEVTVIPNRDVGPLLLG